MSTIEVWGLWDRAAANFLGTDVQPFLFDSVEVARRAAEYMVDYYDRPPCMIIPHVWEWGKDTWWQMAEPPWDVIPYRLLEKELKPTPVKPVSPDVDQL